MDNTTPEQAIAMGYNWEALLALVTPLAEQCIVKNGYWLTDDPACLNYCAEHIDAAAAERGMERDGGWSWEHDGSIFCETCGVRLEGSFTDYACEQEMDVLLETGITTADDAWVYERICGCALMDEELWRGQGALLHFRHCQTRGIEGLKGNERTIQ